MEEVKVGILVEPMVVFIEDVDVIGGEYVGGGGKSSKLNFFYFIKSTYLTKI